MPQNVLIVEDDTPSAGIYTAYLMSEDYEVQHVERGGDGLEILSSGAIDVALIDLSLPDMDGFELLRHVQDHQLSVELIVITGNGSLNKAVEAMKLGASDFLVKPFSKDRLLVTVKNTLLRHSLDNIVRTYRDEIDRKNYKGFVGSSLVMQGVYRVIESAAQSKVSVFITGESGTGKEVCAEAIHRASNRAERPFIPVNCGAIPKDLIESELFGHVKGAFTGAVAERKGAAQAADGGTLFLDEIGELDISLQPKLLRFLQTGQIQPVGSNKLIDVDVRIICATNKDPLAEVAAGKFREDLYYRLHVLPIELPPLRDRGDDVIEIAGHFLERYSAEEGKRFSEFSKPVEAVLMNYDWPGNVRQLQNVIRNITVLHDGDVVDDAMLPAPLSSEVQENVIDRHGYQSGESAARPVLPSIIETPVSAQFEYRVGNDVSSIRPLAELELEIIENALHICRGNVPEAAHYLGVSAATIYRKKAILKNREIDC